MPAESKAAVSFKAKPSLARPLNQTGAVKWLREHVFYSAGSVLLTFVLLYLIGQLLYEFVDWALINAVWEAESRRECTNINAEGACWAGVIEWMNNIMYGRYPLDQQWRVDLALGLLVPWLLPLWVRGVRDKHLVGLSAVLVYPFLAGPLILGGERGWLTQGLFALSLTVFAWIVLQCMAGVLGNCSFHDWVDKQGKRL